MKPNYYDTPMGRSNLRAICEGIMRRVIAAMAEDAGRAYAQRQSDFLDLLLRQPDENNNG